MRVRYLLAIGLLAAIGCASQQNSTSGEWLMIVPPPDSNGVAETTQPLSNLEVIGNFSNQVDCNSNLNSQKFRAQSWYGPIARAQSANQATDVKILNGQCVLRGGLQGQSSKYSARQPVSDLPLGFLCRVEGLDHFFSPLHRAGVPRSTGSAS